MPAIPPSDCEFPEFPELSRWTQAAAPLPASLVLAPVDEASAEFEANTMRALARIRAILELEPDAKDPNYGAVLRAQAATAASQIVAQLRVFEGRLKAKLAERDFYNELTKALENYRNR